MRWLDLYLSGFVHCRSWGKWGLVWFVLYQWCEETLVVDVFVIFYRFKRILCVLLLYIFPCALASREIVDVKDEGIVGSIMGGLDVGSALVDMMR